MDLIKLKSGTDIRGVATDGGGEQVNLTPEAVETSLRDTNRHCNRREEILTDRVYCYRRETQSLGIIDNGEFLEVKRDE